MWNVKHIQQSNECILSVQTGVCQPAFLVSPLGQPAVIESLFAVLNDERDNVVVQALLQSNQSANSAVSILERVDVFKLSMECDHILNRYLCIVQTAERRASFSSRRICRIALSDTSSHSSTGEQDKKPAIF